MSQTDHPEPPAQPPLAVEIQQIGCRRGDRVLFENISLRLSEGDGLILTGPNGAGKTSLLRIIAGLLRPTTGKIEIMPTDHERDHAQISRLVGGRDALKSSFSPRETLLFQSRMMPGGRGTSPDQALASFGLASFGLAAMADMPNGWLSSGQRKRVALAGLAICGMARPLWLLDEPTNALDTKACLQLASLIAGHRAKGGIVVAATHQPLDWPDTKRLHLGEDA